MKIKGIIFDKDGTLFDFQSSWGDATARFLKELSDGNLGILNAFAEALKFDLNKKIFLQGSVFIGGTNDETLNLLHSIIPTKTREEVMNIHTDCYLNQKLIPVTNLFRVLKNLSEKGYLMSVATNDLENSTVTQLREAKILNFFTTIIGADSGYGSKPDASQLIEIMKRMGLDPLEMVMVGDSIYDMIAGRSAGLTSIGVLTGVASKTELRPYSDLIFNDISYLCDWLNQQGS